MASHSNPTPFPESAAELLSRLVSARVDFVLLGERTNPMTIVPAPYARNLERLGRVRTDLGAAGGGLAVVHELGSRYQELLYEALPRELYGVVKVQVVPEELAAGVRAGGSAEIRVARASMISR